MSKLHLGCGTVALPGWINLDIDSPVADVVHDLRQPLPFTDGSMRYVYAEHLIEHVSYEDAGRLLQECRRVLTPDGVVRITTPDLAWTVANYLSGVTTQWGRLWQPHSPCALLNEAMRSWGHLYLYDRAEIRSLFRACGFENVVFCRWGVSEEPDLSRLETRPFNNEIIIEARIAGADPDASREDGTVPFLPENDLIDKLIVDQGRLLDDLRRSSEAAEKARAKRESELVVHVEESERLRAALLDDIRNLREVLADRESRLAQQEKASAEDHGRIETLGRSVDDLSAHIRGLEGALTDRNARIDALSDAIRRVAEESEQRSSVILALEGALTERNARIDGLSDEIRRVAEESSQRSSVILALEERVRSDERALEERRAECSSLSATIESRQAEIESLRLRLDETMAAMDRMRQVHQELNGEIDRLRGDLGKVEDNVVGRWILRGIRNDRSDRKQRP